MRYFKLVLLLLVFISLLACNNDKNETMSTDVVSNPETASGDKQDNLPAIEFEKNVHDFGNVIQGEKVTFNFKFKNTGKSDLVISQVKSSCGCTVLKFPKKPIKPGQEDIIKVTFSSKGRKGVQSKSVRVVSNCQPNTKIIKIKAMVIEP